MRTLMVGVVGTLVAAVGFTSTANASATIDLLWGNGRTNIAATNTSSSFVLSVVLTNVQDTAVASVSIDYSDLVGVYSVSSFESNPNHNTTQFLPLVFLSAADTGSTVTNIEASSLPPYVGSGLPAGRSSLLGTITFHKDTDDASFLIVAAFLGPVDRISGPDGIVCDSSDTKNCQLGSASLGPVPVPEPGTVSLLALGLTGFALTVHRRRNCGSLR